MAQGAGLFAREAVKAALPQASLAAARKARRVLRAASPQGESRLTAVSRILQEP
jgi:hypothetical protein